MLAVASTTLLLVGCGPVNAGSAAEDAFAVALDAAHGDWVEELRTSASNTLPFAGDAYGSVVLRDDTPPDVFAAVYEFVTTYPASNFDGSGVEANGVGICIGDPQARAKQQLRDALFSAGATLAGDWRCPPSANSEPLPYRATLADFDTDQRRVRSVGAGAGLTLEASISEPAGTVAAPFDAVPDTLAATLGAVAEETEVRQFALTGTDLVIAITPTGDLSPVQAAADAAAGPALQVQIALGSLDATEQAVYAELAPLIDELRQIPGVDSVTANTQGIVLRVPDAQRVAAIHDAAMTQPELDEIGVTILVGEGTHAEGASQYVRPIGGASEHIGGFVELLDTAGVTQVTVHEAGGGRSIWFAVDVAGPLLDTVQLRPMLPIGADAQLGSELEGSALRLTIADQLRAEDVWDASDTVDLGAFVAAWNAAP